MNGSDTRQGARHMSRARHRADLEENNLEQTTRPSRPFTVADAHALADRLVRNQRLQSDQTMAVKLIRALLAGRAAGDIITLQGE
jgi:hypothetical protein